MIAELILVIIFFIFLGIGSYIIYRQVALVKKGEFRIKDVIQCIIYGIIFSMAVMVVMSMAFIFAIKSPDLWTLSIFPPPDEINPIMLIIPIAVCLGYIMLYPLLDFLYLALSSEEQEGLTIFHKFLGDNLINRFNNKYLSIILATLFYFFVFLIPPLLLTLTGLPLIFTLTSWSVFYPLMILTYYGSKGYIAGISNAFIHIPEIKRSIFLGFEDNKRAFEEFVDRPLPYITIGLMLFVFVWQWISMFQTLNFLATGSLAISTYSYSGMVFITLLFGVIGYFTRFWSRKIKYRGIDIYFAAYLMAAVGINVFANFLIVNIDKLEATFLAWSITSPIPSQYLIFAIPAVIEEIVLILFTSYYFLNRSSDFNENLIYSKITECGAQFDPIPLFNFIKSKNLKLRKHAEETLLKMYERIPLKVDINLNEIKFKYPLLDGLGDPHPNARRIAYKILLQLEREIPEKVIPWIVENLSSPNYDKSIPIIHSLLEGDKELVKNLPSFLIENIINDREWRFRFYAVKILSKILEFDNQIIENINIQKLIDDPNSNVQVEILNTLAKTSYNPPINLIIKKINHQNTEIRSAAIRSLKSLKIEELDSQLISELIPFMEDPSSSVRASIFRVLSSIGNFKKLSVPISAFIDGLTNPNAELRDASVDAITKYCEERPKEVDVEKIINQINEDNKEILESTIILLGKIWERNPKIILNFLIEHLKSEDIDIKETISNILLEKYDKKPDLILENLIVIPDVSKFISKGIVSQTLIKIGKKSPEKTISKLLKYLNSDNMNIRMNAISSLEGLAGDFSKLIDINPIVSILKEDSNKEVKKEASKLLATLSKKNPKLIKPAISIVLNIIQDQETSVKNALAKSLLDIAEETPDIIDSESIIPLISDSDSFIRETATKILAYLCTVKKDKKRLINILINKSLSDNDWIVRETAVKSLGNIVSQIQDKEFLIKKLISLMNDEEDWVRRSAMNILSEMEDLDPSKLPYERVLQNSNHESENVREATAKLLKIFGKKNFENKFENVLNLLEDPSKDVRNRMIDVMVDIIRKEGLEDVLPKLLKHLSDEFSMELQRSIALILGRTARYEDEKIKKRMISLLKIRAEMSQDPVFINTIHKIQEA
ncbi:MAG: hypothetical protein GF317_01725 [Candidatus Lokiarchaeota archaeon]|nr:hypothetical protein [Candidatus Lokiarchaeota archaeon]MBD3198660.1 hypothetical protein [Candidatus Lokiarchaeota archaeon]